MIWVLIFVLCVLMVLSVIKIRMGLYKPINRDRNMPHNLWFYSQLINIEVSEKSANYKELYNCFINYLCRKYRITKSELKKQSIFDLVKSKEDDENLLDLYGELWNSINDLKQSSKSEVIHYVKSIKPLFNKEDFSEWIAEQKLRKDCNDC